MTMRKPVDKAENSANFNVEDLIDAVHHFRLAELFARHRASPNLREFYAIP